MSRSAAREFLVVVLLFAGCAAEETEWIEYPPSVIPDRVMLTIPGDPATTRAVTWRTSHEGRPGRAELVIADADPRHVENARTFEAQTAPWEQGSDFAMGYRVVFDGLLPDTGYAYRVGDGEFWSEWFQFTTSSDQPRDFGFLYFGDVQNDIKSLASRTLRQAYLRYPRAAFMLFAGDLVNRSREQNWGEFFYAGSWMLAATPTIATPGNHEYDRSEEGPRTFSRHWQQIFTYPENGPEGLENRTYYVDYQGTRLVSLDSYLINTDESARRVQAEWLEDVLKENPNNWTIVFMHHPVYSCSYGRDNEELREVLKPIFERYGVDLVLQGHDHTYCRGSTGSPDSGSDSTPAYVVSVTGPKMYGLNLTDWRDRVGSRTQLYQVVEVSESEISVSAYTVLGELYDSFRIVRSQDGTRSVFEDPEVSRIPMRTEIPEQYLERYSPGELDQYREMFPAN